MKERIEKQKTIKQQRIEQGKPVLRKIEVEHVCADCGEIIPVGVQAWYLQSKKDNEFSHEYWHEPVCMTNKEKFQRALTDIEDKKQGNNVSEQGNLFVK